MLGIESGEAFTQVQFLPRRDPRIGGPVLYQLLGEEGRLYPIRVSQHQVGLERIVTFERPFGSVVVQIRGLQLRQVDQRGLQVLRHGHDEDFAASLCVGLPQRGEHLRVTVQAKARKKRRVVLDAVFVALDLLLQGVESLEACGRGGGGLDIVSGLLCSLEVALIAHARNERARYPQADCGKRERCDHGPGMYADAATAIPTGIRTDRLPRCCDRHGLSLSHDRGRLA